MFSRFASAASTSRVLARASKIIDIAATTITIMTMIIIVNLNLSFIVIILLTFNRDYIQTKWNPYDLLRFIIEKFPSK
jgi:hypothetical protein